MDEKKTTGCLGTVDGEEEQRREKLQGHKKTSEVTDIFIIFMWPLFILCQN